MIMKLGQILIRQGLISAQQLEEALNLQSENSKKLGEVLLSVGLIRKDDLQQALLEQYWRQHGYWIID